MGELACNERAQASAMAIDTTYIALGKYSEDMLPIESRYMYIYGRTYEYDHSRCRGYSLSVTLHALLQYHIRVSDFKYVEAEAAISYI